MILGMIENNEKFSGWKEVAKISNNRIMIILLCERKNV